MLYFHLMTQEQSLTEKPIPVLVRKIAIPASIGFFFNTMFNVVDTYFAGKLGTGALAALSASFPIFFLILAASAGISSASTSLTANALGSKNTEKASLYYIQSIILGFIISIILSVIGYFVAPSLFHLMGIGSEYMRYSLDYMNVIFFGAPFFVLASTLNAYLNAIGNTKVFRNILIIGFFLNIIFNPWFMYGGLGVKAFGIAGLAIATILVQIIECTYLIWYLKHNHILKLHTSLWKPNTIIWKEIITQALPSSFNMMTMAIGVFILTYYVGHFGASSVAAYGTAVRIEQIVLLPSIGLNIAALSLAGQNNGAKRIDRIREMIRVCIQYGLYTFFVGILFIFLLAKPLMQVFTSDPQVISMGLSYLSIAIFVFMAYVIMFVGTSTLQAIKKPSQALYLSILRQVILPVAVFTITIKYLQLGLSAIWWGIFFINWITALISLRLVSKALKKREIEISSDLI